MKIFDNIYGTFEIDEPVIQELIRTPAVKRLKKISQYGIPDEFYYYRGYSRFEHSIGVMLLLRILGASLEEQIAGLLHDVSHLAFSHTADWLFHNQDECAHDQGHSKFVAKTEIPEILKKYDYSPERILDESNFSLLEQEIPDLCADRIDYVLRQFAYFKNPDLVKKTLDSIKNYHGFIIFDDKKVAYDFAKNFVEMQTENWGGSETTIRICLLVELFEMAFRKKIIQKDDFWADEKIIMNKLKKSQDKSIQEFFNLLSCKPIGKLYKSKGVVVYKKFRHVDPKILIGKKIERLSKISSEFKSILEEHRTINKRGVEI